MNTILRYILCALLPILVLGCKKNNPITELGSTTNEFSAQLTVSYNNTRPLFGDTVVVTASTWQKDDKIDRVVFFETLYESFGIDLSLPKGTAIKTKDVTLPGGTAKFSTLVLSDTLKSRAIWQTVLAQNLDSYWETLTNNYVIRQPYILTPVTGKYPDGTALIHALSETDFGILKSLLAYSILKEDYLALFPDAPAAHFATAGPYVLSAVGISYLKDRLTRDNLIKNVQAISKYGTYSVKIDVDAVTPSGTVTSAPSRIFLNNL